MRRVQVPTPQSAWGLSCEGPFSPSAKTQRGARDRLASALAAVPALDLQLGSDGWTVVWHGVVFEHQHLLKVTLWCDRSEAALALAQAVAGQLEAAGFYARVAPRQGAAGHPLRERAAYLRSGGVQLGLDPRTAPMLASVAVEEEDRADINFGRSFLHPVLRCPSCGVEDYPARLVAGFPDAELLLAVQLGEVALAGCDIDRRSRKNAACRHCSHEFAVR